MTLQSLPAEIILDVIELLDHTSLCALRLTSPELNSCVTPGLFENLSLVHKNERSYVGNTKICIVKYSNLESIYGDISNILRHVKHLTFMPIYYVFKFWELRDGYEWEWTERRWAPWMHEASAVTQSGASTSRTADTRTRSYQDLRAEENARRLKTIGELELQWRMEMENQQDSAEKAHEVLVKMVKDMEKLKELTIGLTKCDELDGISVKNLALYVSLLSFTHRNYNSLSKDRRLD